VQRGKALRSTGRIAEACPVLGEASRLAFVNHNIVIAASVGDHLALIRQEQAELAARGR
jgi:hypothetical protein